MEAVLIYPNEYRAGMSSLGFQAVWRILNTIPQMRCERAFTPAGISEMPRAVESNRPVGNFDVIAFSLSFETDAIGMVAGLRAASVPLEASKRKDGHPLVIVGGVAATLNPEPISDFADIVVIGEAEEVLPELFARLFELRGRGRTKMLAGAARIPGVYVPRFYRVEYGDGAAIKSRCADRQGVPERIERRWIKDLDQHPTHSAIIAPDAQFGDMGLVEISRGCGRGCRFCAAGFVYRPPRTRSLAALEPSFDLLLKHRPRIGLVASSGADHPQVHDIIDAVLGRGGEVSFASLRVDNLTDKILDAIAKSSRSVTIAPEAGTDRLRRIAGKGIAEDEILDAAERIGARGIEGVKLYYLVGLPTETQDDALEIAELTSRISKAHRGRRRPSRISVSVAPFVPKPHTPFGLHPMERAETLRARIAALRSLLHKVGVPEARFESVTESVFQAVISRGDRRAAALIKRAADPDGSLRKALREPPPWVNDVLYSPRNIDDPASWDFIDSHIGIEHLYSEYHQGLLARNVNPCRPSKCKSCEACR